MWFSDGSWTTGSHVDFAVVANTVGIEMEPVTPRNQTKLVENQKGVDGICDVWVLAKKQSEVCLVLVTVGKVFVNLN